MATEVERPRARPGELSDELLRLLVDRVEDYAIFVLTPTGHVASWNTGAQRIKGYRADEIIGKHFSRFYRREEIDAGKCEMELSVAARVGRFEDEGWRLRADASEFWANVVITALRNDDGNLVGFAKVTRDLTARRASEEGARRLAEAQASTQIADALQDLSTAFAAALTRADVVGVVATRVLSALDADGGSLATCTRDGHGILVEWAAGRNDDETPRRMALDDPSPLAVAIRTKAASFPDGGAVLPLVVRGACIGAFVLTRATNRSFTSSEQALAHTIANQCALALDRASVFERELEAKHRADFLAQATTLLSSSLELGVVAQRLGEAAVPVLGEWCVIAHVEDDGLQPLASVHVDERHAAIPTDLRSRPIVRLRDDDLLGEVVRSGAARRHAAVDDEHLRALCADAPLAALRRLGLRSAVIVPLRVGLRTTAVMALAWAHSERSYRDEDLHLIQEVCNRAALAMENARLYSELQHAVRARDDFMSVAGHELRTPLAAMQLTLQSLDRLLGKQVGADPSVRDRVGKALRNGERLARLIAELLDVARLRSNRLQLDVEELDLAQLVQNVVNGLAELVSRSSSELRLELEAPIVGRFDRFRLEQVVTNLVTNALKYGLGKPVDVELRRDGSIAVLAVRDQGIGIEPVHHRRIFERFERAVTDRNYGGLGLGLWISRQIVEASGGSIEVNSAPGEGSRFVVRLPLAAQEGMR